MLSSPCFAFPSLMKISQSICLSLWFITLKTDQWSYCRTTFSYGTWCTLSLFLLNRQCWLDLKCCPWIAGDDTAVCWMMLGPVSALSSSSLSSLSAALIFYFPVNQLIFFCCDSFAKTSETYCSLDSSLWYAGWNYWFHGYFSWSL